MASRSEDWLAQARSDLETAALLRDQSRFDWASFVAQQAAEKAVKAVLQARGHSAWGHAVAELLEALSKGASVEVPGDLFGCALRLDRNYIGARYPDGWAEGAPHRKYSEDDADEAIDCAGTILRFCEALLVR